MSDTQAPPRLDLSRTASSHRTPPKWQNHCASCVYIGQATAYLHTPEEAPERFLLHTIDVYLCPRDGLPAFILRYAEDTEHLGPTLLVGDKAAAAIIDAVIPNVTR